LCNRVFTQRRKGAKKTKEQFLAAAHQNIFPAAFYSFSADLFEKKKDTPHGVSLECYQQD
jgi:hypothetical protein